MKKLVNGKQINIPIEFFSDFLLGQNLRKITLSNIFETNKTVDSKIDSCIETYKSIYNSLHPIMRIAESNLKYCIIGELIKKPYSVKNLTLEIFINKDHSCFFKGENWSYGTSKKDGKTLRDFEDNNTYSIYKNYLDFGKEKWFKNSFPELWDALDENEDKLENILPEICDFISVSKLNLDKNEIYDLDLKTKYTVIPEFTINSLNSKTILVLEDTIKKVKDNSSYNFKVLKQSIIESSTGKKDYGNCSIINDFYPEVWEKLNKINNNTLKGIILNKVLYFEIDKDIYRDLNGKVEKLIQHGKLYGNKLKNLLFYHDTRYSETITKRVIYILKDNSYDIAKVEFLVGDNND